MPTLRSALRRFIRSAPAFLNALLRDTTGNVAIMISLLALPLIGLSGLAVDNFIIQTGKAKLDQAADAAALAAIKLVSQDIQSGSTTAAAIADGQSAGAGVFSANSGHLYSIIKPLPNISISINNTNIVSSTVSYTTTGTMSFGQMFGVSTSHVSGSSAATMSLPTYINVYLMVDTSGSTSIGASSVDQQNLIQQTGCAFACHDGNSVNGYADAYTYAEAKNIVLRYDVLNTGIKNFLTTIDGIDPNHQYVSTSIYSFDSSLRTLVPLTSNTNTLRAGLPTAPATSSEYDGATHFNESIASVMHDIGTGGNGTSPLSPKKLLIIATDGVEDPNRTWTYDLSLRPMVQVIDVSFCNTLKSANVTPAFIHMPYLPMTWDWGYVATLGQPANNGTAQTRVDLVQPALQACAGNFYALASDTASLSSAFSNIFQSFVGVRLTN